MSTHRATIAQCAILFGGSDPSPGATLPKPLRPCGGRPFLAWPMREMLRFGVTEFLLLTALATDEIKRAVADLQAALPRPARIVLSAGTQLRAAERLAERLLVVNSETLFAGNLGALLADAASDADGVGARLLLRSHPPGARNDTVHLVGDRVTGFQADGGAGPIHAGVGIFRRDAIEMLVPNGSPNADLLPELARAGRLRGTLAEGYFRDIAEPADCAAARAELPGALRRRALFLDRDGVINVDHGYVGTRERFEWIPGALEAIRMASAAGWHVFVVTNQSGVARGYYAEDDVRALLDWIADEARVHGGTIDDARYCPYHPEATIEAYRRTHPWRKPAPGMLLDLMRAWDVAPGDAIMIGDQKTDMEAASAAGVTGHLFPGGNLADFLRPLLAGFA